MDSTIAIYAAGALALVALARKAATRLALSRAKHPSLTGHSRIARRVTAQIPFYEYDERSFFDSDDAPADVAASRRQGFFRLAETFRARFPETVRMTDSVTPHIPDLQFTSVYRVPFQYSRFVREHLQFGSFVRASDGPLLEDLDGNRLYDLAGSYGVNVFGYEFYKACMAEAATLVRDLGPVLGAYHPVVAYNVRRLVKISVLAE